MRNILMLTSANLRKHKGQAASLLLFVIIAAMFLDIGLVIFTGVGGFFEKRAEELNAEHFTAVELNEALIADELNYLENYPGVTETEALTVVGGFGNTYIGGTESHAYIFIAPASDSQKMNPCRTIGEVLPLTGDSIYIPYCLFLSGGYKQGDGFKLSLFGKELNFTVAGATEEIKYGAAMNQLYRFYVSDAKYNELRQTLSDARLYLVSARLEDASNAVFLEDEFNREYQSETMLLSIGISAATQARTLIPTIAAVFVILFAIILLVVSLIVIRFRIVSSILENMTNIGAQKAVGFRSVQIILSIVLQFGFISAVGCIMGLSLAQPAIPAITRVMEPVYALVWVPRFDPLSAFISFLAVTFMVILVSFLSARSINKLHPLVALRAGLATHSFRKNHLPLDKTRGALDILLGFKHLMQNKKQALTISVIVAAVTMASVIATAVDYSLNVNGYNFARAAFGEIPDVNFTLKDASEGEGFKERLLKYPEVRKVFGYEAGTLYMQVDGTNVVFCVAEDCSLLEGAMLIDGRYPKHNNEIAVGPVASRVTGKGINDRVIIINGEHEREYIITGLVQYINNDGLNGLITGEGLSGVAPGYEFAAFNVYLNDGADAKDFIQSVKAAQGDLIDVVLDTNGQVYSMLDTVAAVFSAVAAGTVIITALVVVATLFLVIKTLITQRRRELGIQKAVGFTTFRLMNQIALNLTPIILIGVTAGGGLGYFGFNPFFTAIARAFGLAKLSMPVPLDRAAAICAGLVILAYAVSLLIAWRIRKISAYALVSE